MADCGCTGQQCGGKSWKWSEWNFPEWTSRIQPCSWSLRFVYNRVLEGEVKRRRCLGGPGARAPDQFWMLTIHSLLPSGPGDLLFCPSDLCQILEHADSVHGGEKRFVVAFASWDEIIFTGGHVDTRICLISAHFSASGYSAAPSKASRVNCYFKGCPHRRCPVNRGQCLFTSPAWICPNILPKDLKFALCHPQARFFGPVLGVWQMFLGASTGHATLKTKGYIQWLHHLDVVARQHWSDSRRFHFLASSCDFVLRDFCTRICGKETGTAGEDASILHEGDTSNLSFLWLLHAWNLRVPSLWAKVKAWNVYWSHFFFFFSNTTLTDSDATFQSVPKNNRMPQKPIQPWTVFLW